MSDFGYEKKMQMGLGEATQRLNLLHSKMSRGISTEEEASEYTLLLEALNEIKIDLGFDCNDDGVPDTIEIFMQTAASSCCRIVMGGGTSRRDNSRRSRR